MAETIRLMLQPTGEPQELAQDGRKYFTCDSTGPVMLWSTSPSGPWHREEVLRGIDLPNIPMYVKSEGYPFAATVTIYD